MTESLLKVSRTLLSILADLNNVVVWMVSTRPLISKSFEGCPRSVMAKATDCGIVVSEFVLQSRYYVHFRANTLRKGINPFILPAMG